MPPDHEKWPFVNRRLYKVPGSGSLFAWEPGKVIRQALAKALGLVQPNTIHQLSVALECLIEEDAAAARPLIAAFVVSKVRGGLPAPGFFDCARRAGRFDGDPSGPEGSAFYLAEFDKAVEFWRAASEVVDQVPKFDIHLHQHGQANIGPSSRSSPGTTILPSRASRRHVDRCCGPIPCRRATSATLAPGISVSATIRPLSSAD